MRYKYDNEHDNETCLLFDMIIPSDWNMSVKDLKVLSKYKEPQMRIPPRQKNKENIGDNVEATDMIQ